MRRRMHAAGAVAAIAASLVMGVALPAGAAGAASPPSELAGAAALAPVAADGAAQAKAGESTTLLMTATRKADAGLNAAAGPPTISCYLSTGAPFIINAGGAFPTSVIAHNVLVYCTWPMDLLSVDDEMKWNYINTWAFDGESRVLATAVSAAITEECVDGVYHAEMFIRMVPPPNYAGGPQTATPRTVPTWYDCP